jgi:hypothetical protein
MAHVSRDKDKGKSSIMQTHGLAGTSPPPPPGAVEAGLETGIQAHLGRQLRAVYDEVAEQPVPDRFLKLLAELEERSAAAQQQPKGDA